MAQTHSITLVRASSQYLSASDSASLDITGNLTMEMWVKLNSAPTSGQLFGLVAKWSDTGTEQSYGSYYINNGGTPTLRFTFRNSGGTQSTASFVYTLPTSVWTHVAFVYNTAGTVDCYVDGKAQTQVTGLGNTIKNSTSVIRIGLFDEPAFSQYGDFTFKDVRLWAGTRTQAEIISDARTETVLDANVKAEWNFNNAYTDGSGNSNTLTASGSPSFTTDRPWAGSTQISGSTYLATNLNAYWTFDEASGNAADSTGNGFTLTNNNTTAYASGKINNSADLELSNTNYFTRADNASLKPATLSLSVWVNLESTPTNFVIIDKGNNGGDYTIAREGGDIYMRVRTGGTDKTISVVTSPTTATWYHLVLVYNGSTLTGYANGKVVSSTGATGAYGSTTQALTIGKLSTTNDYYLDGRVDEFGLWSRALHYGDVLDLYNAGNAISYTVSASGPANLKSLDGNLKANIKSVDGNLIANIKSIDGNV